MHDNRNHLGVGFRLWNGQSTWFWILADPCGGAGAVGAASSEAEAISEAHVAIEEMAARCRAPVAARFECGFSICG